MDTYKPFLVAGSVKNLEHYSDIAVSTEIQMHIGLVWGQSCAG